MSVLQRTFELMATRKARIENNEINGYPFPIETFRGEIPVIEKGTYALISGQTKSGKSKIANYLFVYHSILYAYEHPDQMRVKIFYFPLEETPEAITLQFMAFLLFKLSKHTIRVDPLQLKSVDADNLLSDEILELLHTKEYTDILEFYDSHVEFRSETNNVGIDIVLKSYAKDHGKATYTECTYTDDITGEKHTGKELSEYIPDDPDEFVIAVVDHVSLLTPTRNDGTLFNAIATLSKNMVYIKNKFKYISVVVQQQSASESGGLEARKTGNIRPTKAGLSDCKNTGNDCTLMIGLTNPYAFEYPAYIGYDVSKLKDSFRVMEVVLNREGRSNGICPLFFDGAVNYFTSLPASNDTTNLNKVYQYITNNMTRKKSNKVYTFFSYIKQKIMRKTI